MADCWSDGFHQPAGTNRKDRAELLNQPLVGDAWCIALGFIPLASAAVVVRWGLAGLNAGVVLPAVAALEDAVDVDDQSGRAC